MSRGNVLVLLTFAAGIVSGYVVAEALRGGERPDRSPLSRRASGAGDGRIAARPASVGAEQIPSSDTPVASPQDGLPSEEVVCRDLLGTMFVDGERFRRSSEGAQREVDVRLSGELGRLPPGTTALTFQLAGFKDAGWLSSFPGLTRGLRLPPTLRIAQESGRRGQVLSDSDREQLVAWLGDRALERRRLENAFLERAYKMMISESSSPSVPTGFIRAYVVSEGRITWLETGDSPQLDEAIEDLERYTRACDEELKDRIMVAGQEKR